jgi:hypothetical protein
MILVPQSVWFINQTTTVLSALVLVLGEEPFTLDPFTDGEKA